MNLHLLQERIPVILSFAFWTFTDCARPLGMENSKILDFMITSPDSYPRHPSSYARLNGRSSWCTTSQTYLQIDFNRPYKLTAIATQGETRLNKWVKKYTIGFYAGATLLVYNESGSQKVRILRLHRYLLK